jgi:hypothetical protein
MTTFKGKRVLTSLYLDPAIADELRKLSATTRVPQAVYLREAVDLLLAHYRHTSDLIVGKERSAIIPVPPTLSRIVKAADLLEKCKPRRKSLRKVK